jgi:hypothetical protein
MEEETIPLWGGEMSGLIIHGRGLRKTARLLSRKLGFELARGDETESHPVVIRWGNSTASLHGSHQLVLNEARAIRRCANKYEARKYMASEGIVTPRVIEPEEVESHNVEYPILARKKFHRRGQYFEIVSGYEEAMSFITQDWFLQELIPFEREYRLIGIGGEVIEYNRKVPNDDKEVKEYEPRNHEHGYWFKLVKRRNVPQCVIDEGVKAARFADITATDILYSTDGNAYVLEVNTAPGLTVDRKLTKVADFLKHNMHGRCAWANDYYSSIIRELREKIDAYREGI